MHMPKLANVVVGNLSSLWGNLDRNQPLIFLSFFWSGKVSEGLSHFRDLLDFSADLDDRERGTIRVLYQLCRPQLSFTFL